MMGTVGTAFGTLGGAGVIFGGFWAWVQTRKEVKARAESITTLAAKEIFESLSERLEAVEKDRDRLEALLTEERAAHRRTHRELEDVTYEVRRLKRRLNDISPPTPDQ